MDLNQSWSQLKDWWQQDVRAPWVVNIIGLLLLLIILVQAVQGFLVGLALPKPLKKVAIAVPHRDRVSLASLHLFGVYNELAQLPSTRLPLTLSGTLVVVGSPQQSYALIAAGNDKTKLYQPGDQVAGATVQQIRKNGVVLLVDGQRQWLRLPFPELGASTTAAVTGQAAVR